MHVCRGVGEPDSVQRSTTACACGGRRDQLRRIRVRVSGSAPQEAPTDGPSDGSMAMSYALVRVRVVDQN